MNRSPLRIVALDSTVDRSSFSSRSAPLDRYFREQVSQDVRRRVAACFVALDEDQQIVGYYTLATASVPLTDLPGDIARKLPRYAAVPAIRMGRLAVDEALKGQGLGRCRDSILRFPTIPSINQDTSLHLFNCWVP